MSDLPYALGCPSCIHYVEVSAADPDASFSELYHHALSRHANYDREKADALLVKARDLTAEEATR